jgi:hypothetical protein
MHRIRQMTGVCPQHDILFDMLTPREHLEFFAAVRVSVPLYQIHSPDSFVKQQFQFILSNWYGSISFSPFLSVHVHELCMICVSRMGNIRM